MDRSADARIGATATQVGGHGRIDVLIRGRGVEIQKRGRLHDLARLAVAALRDLMFDPGFLNGVQTIGLREPLNGYHFAAGQIADGKLTGPHRKPIDMNSAGPALRNAAAVFRARDVQFISEHPKQRHVRGDIHFVFSAVDG